MAALKEILDEQARIKNELQRMEDDDSVTEEDSGDLRDTLVERWEQLDTKAKPLIERMEKVRGITRAAADEANLERPNGNGASASRYGSPDLVITNNRDPFDCQELIRHERQILMTRAELRGRALDAIELDAKRGSLPHDFAEAATVKAQGNAGHRPAHAADGSQEYYDAFREYTAGPGACLRATRAALTLSSQRRVPAAVRAGPDDRADERRVARTRGGGSATSSRPRRNTWNGVNVRWRHRGVAR